MPTTNQFNDTETTFEVKNYEVILQCCKCAKGYMEATDQPADPGFIIHACTHCQREQVVEGISYPHTFTRKEPTSKRSIERTEIVPDKVVAACGPKLKP